MFSSWWSCMLVIKQNNLRLRCVYTLSLIKKKFRCQNCCIFLCLRVFVYMCAFMRACVRICVCVRVWERESVCECVRERESACVCVWERERERDTTPVTSDVTGPSQWHRWSIFVYSELDAAFGSWGWYRQTCSRWFESHFRLTVLFMQNQSFRI